MNCTYLFIIRGGAGLFMNKKKEKRGRGRGRGRGWGGGEGEVGHEEKKRGQG